MNNSNYPIGAANDPAAPYNEPITPIKDVSCDVCITLRHGNMPLTTDCYTAEFDAEDGYEIYTYDNEELTKEYKESSLFITELLKEYAEMLRALSNKITEQLKDTSLSKSMKKMLIAKRLLIYRKIAACLNWNVEELSVEEA